MATICCASTSSGLRRKRVDSTSPSCMARVTAAQATRSARYLGKMTPSLAAPTWCPARPMRCMPLATEGGASIWTTRSTAPMSMPSSSEEVRHERADVAGLQQLFDLRALRGRERAVMSACQWFAGQFIDRAGQPLGDPPAVDEDDGGGALSE